MRRYIKHSIIGALILMVLAPNVKAQVDLQSSFMVMRKDSLINGFLEGGEWIIRFTDTDTLGNIYDYPVAMNIQSVVKSDTAFVPLQDVDSVLFQLPKSEMEHGVFELKEEHFKYIVSSDSVTTVNFRIDCLTQIDLPRVGQKVICNILRDPLPFGLVGQVKSVKVSYDDGYIQMVCNPLTLSDIYTRYYKVSVTDEMGESVAPSATRATRALAPPMMSPQDYDITPKKLGCPYKGAGYLVCDDNAKLKVSNDPSVLSSSHKFSFGVELDGSVAVYHISAIDRELDLDYTDVFIEFDLLAKIPLKFTMAKFNPMKNMWEGTPFEKKDKIELDFPNIPTPVPGLSITTRTGMEYDASIQLVFQITPTIPLRKRIGLHIDGLKSSGIFEDLPGDNKPKDNNEDGLNTSVLLSGSISLGMYIEAGLSIANLFDLVVNVKPTVRLNGSIDFNPGHINGRVTDIENGDIDMMKTIYTGFTQNNGIKIDAGVILDGKAKIPTWDILEWSLVEFLKSVGVLKGDPFMFPAFRISALSPFTPSDISLMSIGLNDYYYMTFERDATAETALFQDKAKGGLFFKDKSNKFIISREIDSWRDIYDTNNAFDLGQSCRGEKVSVYPYLYTTYTGYMTPGKVEDVYIPFQPTIEIVGEPSYDVIKFKGAVVEDEIKNNLDKYRKVRVLIEVIDKSESGFYHDITQSYDLDDKGEFEGKIERHIFQNYFGQKAKKANISVQVYDPDDDKYCSSEKVYAEYLDMSKPTTLAATDVTYNSATLHAELSEDLIFEIHYGESKVKLGFLYHIPGVSGTTQEVEFNAIDIIDNGKYYHTITGLRSNTQYEYYAYTRVNNVRYDGDVFYLNTQSPISNIRYESGSDFMITYADIVQGFVDASTRQDIYFELTDFDDRKFEKATRLNVEPEDWTIHEDGSATVDVMFLDLTPSTYYRYRLVLIDASGYKIISEEKVAITSESDLKATTGYATVEGNTAKIRGSLSPYLLELLKSQDVKNAYFEYSKEEKFISSTVVFVPLDDTEYSTTLSDLSYETVYYYRFCAMDRDNTVYEGDILSFVTDDPPVDNVEECYTLSASVEDANVVMTGGVPAATLNAIENGTYKNVQYGFEVATSKGELTGNKPTFVTNEIDKDTGLFTITKVLQPNTLYYIRAMVFFNDKWVVAPETVSVKTADFDPGLVPPDV